MNKKQFLAKVTGAKQLKIYNANTLQLHKQIMTEGLILDNPKIENGVLSVSVKVNNKIYLEQYKLPLFSSIGLTEKTSDQ